MIDLDDKVLSELCTIRKNFLNEKIKGKKVSVRRVTEDKYGRTVGELSFNGEIIQELLVKEGHAEIYKKYSKPCKWAS